MTSLILIGSGGAASEVISYVDDINRSQGMGYTVEGFLDSSIDNFEINKARYDLTQPLLGNPSSFEYTKNYGYVITFADPQKKLILARDLSAKGLDLPNLIHPTAVISKTSRFGVGNIISPYCVIGPGCIVGNFNLLTSFSFVSHDCELGSCNFLSTAGLSGGAKVGSNNYFGIRATVLPDIVVGDDCVIQAGMILDRNVKSKSTVYYRFKERIQVLASSLD